MLFGPRAATRLNGPSVHHGAARYLRNVMCAPLKGRRSENSWDGEAKRRLERRDGGRDRDARATQRNDKTSARQGPMKMQKEKGRDFTHTRTRNAHRGGRIVYKHNAWDKQKCVQQRGSPKLLCLFF